MTPRNIKKPNKVILASICDDMRDLPTDEVLVYESLFIIRYIMTYRPRQPILKVHRPLQPILKVHRPLQPHVEI